MTYEIENDVPIPNFGRPRHQNGITQSLRKLAKAPVGSSIFVPDNTQKNVGGYVQLAKTQTGAAFTCRTVDGGVRVWRIA